MWADVNIVCFAASYAVALALEVTRLWFRSGLRGALMLGFGAAGLLAHTIFLAHRAAGSAGAPLSTAYDWYLVAAWILTATYLYLTFLHPKSAVGLFVLPLVLALIGVAVWAADLQPFPQTRAAQYWGLVHGGFLLAGTVAVSIGLVAGLMYLLQAWRLKHKRPPWRGLQLPSLEWLEHVNSRAILYSLLLLAVGVASGGLLNLVNQKNAAASVPWTDPVVISSLATLGWLLAAAAFSYFYKPARTGRKVAYLTVASAAFLALTLAVTLLVPGQHQPRPTAIDDPGNPSPAANLTSPRATPARGAP